MFVIGRGPEFATAREIALKLLETCRTAAAPLTATDLAHGPVAVLDPLFPVWAIASRDETLSAVQEAVARVRQFGSMLVASGTAADAIPNADYTPRVPGAAARRCSRRSSPSSRASCSPRRSRGRKGSTGRWASRLLHVEGRAVTGPGSRDRTPERPPR